MWLQKNILVGPCSRGFHIITDLIINEVPEIEKINIGVLHLFIKHTSASLTLNENADQTVREDFESHFNELVPDFPDLDWVWLIFILIFMIWRGFC